MNNDIVQKKGFKRILLDIIIAIGALSVIPLAGFILMGWFIHVAYFQTNTNYRIAVIAFGIIGLGSCLLLLNYMKKYGQQDLPITNIKYMLFLILLIISILLFLPLFLVIIYFLCNDDISIR